MPVRVLCDLEGGVVTTQAARAAARSVKATQPAPAAAAPHAAPWRPGSVDVKP